MEELREIYNAAFIKADEIIEIAIDECRDYEKRPEDLREIASHLFTEYNRRIAPQYKGTTDQHEKGNNDSNPASIAQKKLIRTLIMTIGAPAEAELEKFRNAYGLEARTNMGELEELKMGQASDIITRLKEMKPRR